MNDLEDKLRALEFSKPNPQWRREILDQCQAKSEPATRWSDWLWPSPLAWAALVLIWLGCGISNRLERPEHTFAGVPAANPEVLYAVKSPEEIEAIFTLKPRAPRL